MSAVTCVQQSLRVSVASCCVSMYCLCDCRCDWLNNKNTIFGKIVGDTIYNMLRFNDLEVGCGLGLDGFEAL